MGFAKDEPVDETEDLLAERLQVIEAHDLPDAALERFVDRRGISIQQQSDEFRENICIGLSDEQFEDLLHEYKYAGQQTINYFVMTGISDFEFTTIVMKCENESPDEQGVEGATRKPYLADSEVYDGNLYLSYGYFASTGGEDPATGRRTSDFVKKRVVAVFGNDSDLVQMRASDKKMAERVRDHVGGAVGVTNTEDELRSDAVYRPKFDMEFQKEFGDRLVEKYYNLRIRVNDREGGTIDNIQFTSRKDESGERKDARADERVSRELDEHGGEITMGYVELHDGSTFFINRKGSRLSFQRFETETKLNEISELIHDVLRETGGFEQRTLAGIENIPD